MSIGPMGGVSFRKLPRGESKAIFLCAQAHDLYGCPHGGMLPRILDSLRLYSQTLISYFVNYISWESWKKSSADVGYA